MRLTVRYFASMRERMGRAGEELNLDCAEISVAELWAAHLSSDDLPLNTLIAVNMDYAKATALVHDGDEVAFFPPVTGG